MLKKIALFFFFLNFFIPAYAQFTYLQNPLGSSKAAKSRSINTIICTKKGAILFSTNWNGIESIDDTPTNGLFIFEGNVWKSKQFDNSKNAFEQIYNLRIDRNENVVAFNTMKGTIYSEPNLGLFSYPDFKDILSKKPLKGVYSDVQFDDNSNLWFSQETLNFREVGLNGSLGLFNNNVFQYFDLGSIESFKLGKDNKVVYVFGNSYISEIDLSTLKRKYIADRANTFVELNKEKTFVMYCNYNTLYKYENSIAVKLSTLPDELGVYDEGKINCSFIDSKNNYYLGTRKGLYIYSNGKWKIYNESNSNLSNVNILAVDEGTDGKIWIAGDNREKNYSPSSLTTFICFLYDSFTNELKSTFSYTPTSPQTNQSITFKDESTGSPTTWAWDFGDGTTANIQNPTKTYSKAGTYTVKLTVSKTGATPVISTKEITVVAVSTNAGTLSVVAQSQNAIPVEGGSINLSVTSNIDWQLTSNATWLKPSITGGSGNGTVTLTAEKNTLTNDRTAKITFTGKNVTNVEITVNQNKVGLTTATSAPFNLSAKTTSPTTIGLSWEQKGILPSTKFLIEQEQSNGSFKEIGRTTNSLPTYSIEGLTPNTTYCFRTKTLLNQLESLPSNKACATTKINNFKRGVTVVTHGFQLLGSVENDGKVNNFVLGDKEEIGMCAAIKQRIEREGGTASIYRNDINTSKWIKVNDEESKSTDEIILFYNWAIVSNDFLDGALEASADNLFAMLARPNVKGDGQIPDNLFDSDLPFHFIAHSRGNIVLLQVLHRMFKYFPNKRVEHFTLLDPHPAKPMNDINEENQKNSLPGIYGLPKNYSSNEPFISLPSNVLKSDVYYRQDVLYEPLITSTGSLNIRDWSAGNFSGIDVKNASLKIPLVENIIREGSSLPHTGVHQWYKGTIANNDPYFENRGRVNWYKTLGRNNYGYNLSRVGGNIGKLKTVTNGIDSTEMDKRIESRTGKKLNPVFNGNFQYVLDGLKSLTKKYALYGYYFNGGKSEETKLLSPSSGIEDKKYVLSDPITSTPFILTHSNLYFPKSYKYLKITVGEYGSNSKLKVDYYNTLDSVNSVGGTGIIFKAGVKNYYAPIPQSLVGDIGRFTLSSQNKYLVGRSFFTDIEILNLELVDKKLLNGGRQSAEQQIIVFPNPTTDKVTIDLSEIEDNIESIILKDAQGNDIKEIPIPIDGKLIQLNLKSYRMGIYFIQVNTNENVITKKIILNQE